MRQPKLMTNDKEGSERVISRDGTLDSKVGLKHGNVSYKISMCELDFFKKKALINNRR